MRTLELTIDGSCSCHAFEQFVALFGQLDDPAVVEVLASCDGFFGLSHHSLYFVQVGTPCCNEFGGGVVMPETERLTDNVDGSRVRLRAVATLRPHGDPCAVPNADLTLDPKLELTA